MAIILPVLMTIVLGIVEYSLAFKDSLSVTSATRAGARTASAQPRTTTFASDTAAAVSRAITAIDSAAPEVLWIYRADVNGLPDNGNFTGTCTVCVRYAWDTTLTPGPGWRLVNDGWLPSTHNACAGTAQAVGVYIRAEHQYLTRLFGTSVTLEDHTVMRLEPIPTSAQCAP
jgi:Flp pilus assembly protein TadG